jgi:hypothetical protein
MKPQDRVVLIAKVTGTAAPRNLTRGYSYSEASQFIEFCVELDNQDDRTRDRDRKNPDLWPQIDPGAWLPEPIFDSRKSVVEDLLAYRKNNNDPSLRPWHKLFDEILARAEGAPPANWDFPTVASDARYNGFGPYQSA